MAKMFIASPISSPVGFILLSLAPGLLPPPLEGGASPAFIPQI